MRVASGTEPGIGRAVPIKKTSHPIQIAAFAFIGRAIVVVIYHSAR